MSESAVFDKVGALDRVEDDLELFFELYAIFLDEYGHYTGEVKQAVESGDGEKLESAAHSIKSALGNVGAMSSFAIASQLESLGREKELGGAASLFDTLQSEIEKYIAAVNVFKES